jgi:hypothetical protein
MLGKLNLYFVCLFFNIGWYDSILSTWSEASSM